jgi:hypothetical protein
VKKLSKGWIFFLIADTALVIAIIVAVLHKG